MDLNWTPEVIVDFINGLLFLIGGLFCFKKKILKENKTKFYLKLVWISLSLFFIFEGLSYLLLNTTLGTFYAILTVLATIFLLMAINYNYKEKFHSKSLYMVFILGGFLIFLAFQPNAAQIVLEYGYYTIIWLGLFNVIGIIFIFIFSILFFVWVLITWLNAPYEIKREANYYFLSALLCSIVPNIIYIFTFWIPSLILLVDIFLFIGLFGCNIVIAYEPKILYILPFKPKVLYVRDSNGTILFTYRWANIKSGILDQVLIYSNKIKSEELKVIDISVNYDRLILYKTPSFEVGLLISKVSEYLKHIVVEFTQDFEKIFNVFLEKKEFEKDNFINTYELIEKYFNIFPSRLIENNKQNFLISKQYYDLSSKIQEKVHEIFPKKEEFEFFKCEIQRSSNKLFSEFLELRSELNEEEKESKND